MSEDIPIQDPGSLLADAFYKQPDTTPEEPAEPQNEAVKAPSEDISPESDPDVPGSDNEPENDAQAASEDTPEGDEGGEESNEIQLETFEQLAEHLEADPEYLQGLSITQKVNGEEVQVKLADALQTHRQVEAGDAYLKDAKSKAKNILNEATEQKQALGETVAVLSGMMESVEQQINADVASTDWAQLRVDDPAEYTARQHDIETRRTALNTKKQEVVDKYRGALQQIDADEKQRQIDRLPEEQARLHELVPDWTDSEKASAEQPEVVKYLQEQGYTEQQIQAVSYHAPSLSMAIKARRYDLAKGKSQAAKKKVVKIPKVIKPGKKVEGESKPKPDPNDRATALYGA